MLVPDLVKCISNCCVFFVNLLYDVWCDHSTFYFPLYICTWGVKLFDFKISFNLYSRSLTPAANLPTCANFNDFTSIILSYENAIAIWLKLTLNSYTPLMLIHLISFTACVLTVNYIWIKERLKKLKNKVEFSSFYGG